MLKRLIAVAMFCPLPALAACPDGSTNMLSCTFNDGSKTVTTCIAEDMALYSYGPTGSAPDLAMIRNVRDVDMRPWNGIGRYLWESFSFYRGDYEYDLHYAIDRLTEGNPIEGGLRVLHKGEVLANLSCDADGIETAGYPLPLFDAKIAAGQEWVFGEDVWRDAK